MTFLYGLHTWTFEMYFSFSLFINFFNTRFIKGVQNIFFTIIVLIGGLGKTVCIRYIYIYIPPRTIWRKDCDCLFLQVAHSGTCQTILYITSEPKLYKVMSSQCQVVLKCRWRKRYWEFMFYLNLRCFIVVCINKYSKPSSIFT